MAEMATGAWGCAVAEICGLDNSRPLAQPMRQRSQAVPIPSQRRRQAPRRWRIRRERVALGTNGFHLDSLARRLRRCDNRFSIKVERDAEHISIFDVEQMVIVEVI